jgi:uncharacterized protein HemY
LLKIPTGAGMALVFYTSPEAPAQCAVEITRALKEHSRLQLRMARVSARMGEPDRAMAALEKPLSIPYDGALAQNVPLTPARSHVRSSPQ